jgi:hypothetical protein
MDVLDASLPWRCKSRLLKRSPFRRQSRHLTPCSLLSQTIVHLAIKFKRENILRRLIALKPDLTIKNVSVGRPETFTTRTLS